MMANAVMEALNGDDPLIAVVGATDNPAKYGAIIYRTLKRKGYRVVAVNPNRSTVDGDPAYPTLAELPVVPDIIDIVIPPQRALDVLEQAERLGMRTVWVQPGAESPAVVRHLQDNGFAYIVDACIMVAARPRKTPSTQDHDTQ